MLFSKNDSKINERILYKTKPNMLLGCKKAIYGIILLVIVLALSSIAIKFVGEMQVYMISFIRLSLTRYVAIAFFVIILITVIYIIWQLIGWYSTEYTLTDSKIIIKSGVLSIKKNYMPYTTIQDINTSQSIFAKLFNVGSVSVFSAYDNNQFELKDISNPSEVEEIIFSRMMESRNFQVPPQSMPQYYGRDYEDNDEIYPDNRSRFNEGYSDYDEYVDNDEYYDEYEPITPITHEKNASSRREYEYYLEDFKKNYNQSRHTYEYEPYVSGVNKSPNNIHNNNRYNKIPDEYSHSDDDYYQNNDSQRYYNEGVKESSKNTHKDVYGSSQKVIKRHFDKFKR